MPADASAGHRLNYPRPVSSPLRESVENLSRPLLVRLSRLPAVVPFLTMLALLLLGGVIGGPVGFVLVGIGALFIAWLLYLSWPRLTATERLMRAAVVTLAMALAIVQLFPRG